jgi:hypothetical protein
MPNHTRRSRQRMPGQPRRSVSHVIVLFDFIEEMYEKGEPFIEAVLDAGIERLRPVMITVGATVLGTFPSFHPRRPALGTVVLRTDRRPQRRNLH